jgi:hypothetical protein
VSMTLPVEKETIMLKRDSISLLAVFLTLVLDLKLRQSQRIFEK